MSAGAINGAGPALGTTGGGAFASLKSEDFIKVLLSELSNQDPFEPQDSGALLEQLSNIRNIESQQALQDKLESLVLQNELSSASGLIGKTVVGHDARGREVQGQVTSVRVEAGSAILELDTGAAIPIERLIEIADSQDAPEAIDLESTPPQQAPTPQATPPATPVTPSSIFGPQIHAPIAESLQSLKPAQRSALAALIGPQILNTISEPQKPLQAADSG